MVLFVSHQQDFTSPLLQHTGHGLALHLQWTEHHSSAVSHCSALPSVFSDQERASRHSHPSAVAWPLAPVKVPLVRTTANFWSVGAIENFISLLEQLFLFCPCHTALKAFMQRQDTYWGHTDENRALTHVSRTQSKESSHTLEKKNHNTLQIKLVLGRDEIS